MRAMLVACLLLGAACAGAPLPTQAQPAATDPARIELRGLGGQHVTLSATDLAAGPRRSVRMEIHGATHVFEGVALADLLARVDAPLGERLRGPELADVVIVSARDGYRVALALSEIDPGLGGRTAILADRVDGAPIAADDGPFRLVIEGDRRPARSARQVSEIAVVRVH